MFAMHFAVQQFVAACDTPQPACLQSDPILGVLLAFAFCLGRSQQLLGAGGRQCSQESVQRVPVPGVQGCSAEVRAVQTLLPSAGDVRRELAAWKEASLRSVVLQLGGLSAVHCAYMQVCEQFGCWSWGKKGEACWSLD